MKSGSPFRLVLVTAGSKKNARSISLKVVQMKLAACANIIPGLLSIYRYKGKIHQDREWLLLIKTRRHHLDKIEKLVRKMHTYDVPEILSLAIDQGESRYLTWLRKETG